MITAKPTVFLLHLCQWRKYTRTLLKVTVSNLQDKITILRNKMKLRDKKLPEHIKSIFVNADLTPLEQKKNKRLREQLKEMNKEGKNYFIKNGTIVQKRI